MEFIKNHLFILTSLLAFALGVISLIKDIKDGKSEVNYLTVSILLILLLTAGAEIVIKSHEQEETKKAAQETIEQISKRTEKMLNRDSLAIDSQLVKLSLLSDSIDTIIKETENNMLKKFNDAENREDVISKSTNNNLIKSNDVLNRTLAISYPFYPLKIRLSYEIDISDTKSKDSLKALLKVLPDIVPSYNGKKLLLNESFDDFSFSDEKPWFYFYDTLINHDDSVLNFCETFLVRNFYTPVHIYIDDGTYVKSTRHGKLDSIEKNFFILKPTNGVAFNITKIFFSHNHPGPLIDVTYWFKGKATSQIGPEIRSLFDYRNGHIFVDFPEFKGTNLLQPNLALYCGDKGDEHEVLLKKEGVGYAAKISDVLKDY